MNRKEILAKIVETERELAKPNLSPQRKKSLNKHRKRLIQSIKLYDRYRRGK